LSCFSAAGNSNRSLPSPSVAPQPLCSGLSWAASELEVEQGADPTDVLLLVKQYLLLELEGACCTELQIYVKDMSNGAARVFVWADLHSMDALIITAEAVLVKKQSYCIKASPWCQVMLRSRYCCRARCNCGGAGEVTGLNVVGSDGGLRAM
jgi:hypothetical protein